ncbi:MAG: Asp/Glu/hydantoin racemase [Lachnospiraceae bacterium]
MRVGVIAGSPVDTKMGAEFLEANGINTISLPVSEGAREQTQFQFLQYEEREQKIISLIKEAIDAKVDKVMIYCNSLSSTIDMKTVSRKTGVTIVTPLDAYEKLGNAYGKIGVMAGNCQGLAGIEKTFLTVSNDIEIVGVSNLSLVEGVEMKISPDNLIKKMGIDKVISYFEVNDVEAIVLGCTHFPYIMEEMKKRTSIPIIDPAEVMYSILKEEE